MKQSDKMIVELMNAEKRLIGTKKERKTEEFKKIKEKYNNISNIDGSLESDEKERLLTIFLKWCNLN